MPGTGTKAGGVIGLALVVVALAAGASLLFLAPTLVSTPSAGAPTPTPTASIPLAGGVPLNQNEDSAGGSVGDVVPFVTGAYLAADRESVTVYSFVPGLLEDGGTCTASIVGGVLSESASGPALIEVADTMCTPIVITLASPAIVPLEVVVEYESAKSVGRSERTEVIEP